MENISKLANKKITKNHILAFRSIFLEMRRIVNKTITQLAARIPIKAIALSPTNNASSLRIVKL